MALSKDLKLEIVRADSDPLYNLFSGSTLLSEDYLLSVELGNDLKRYEEMELDPHVAAVMQKRKMSVTAHEWRVDAAGEDDDSKEAADLVRTLLNLFNFDELSQHMLNAILLGYAVAEIIWTPDTVGKFGAIDRPLEVRGKDSSRFVFTRPKEGKEDPRYQLVNGYELRQLTSSNRSLGERLPINKMVVHSFGSKIGNPNGIGVGNRLWWMVRFKKEITKFWLVFLDRFAQPTPIGTYPPGGSKTELEGFLNSISQGSWAALPEGYKVSLLEAQRSGTVSTYEGFQNWCDSQISKAVLGETLTTTPQDSGGSFAATSVHNDVRTELSKADADMLSYSLNRFLIEPMIRVNRPGVKPPTVWRIFDEQVDLSQRSTRDKTLFDMGFRLTIAKVTEVYGDGYIDTQASGEDDPNSLESVLSDINSPPEGGDPGTGDAADSTGLGDEPSADPPAEPTGSTTDSTAAAPGPGTPGVEPLAPTAAGAAPDATAPAEAAELEPEFEPIEINAVREGEPEPGTEPAPKATSGSPRRPAAFRFPLSRFSLSEVAAWLKQYDVSPHSIERQGDYYQATTAPLDPDAQYITLEIGDRGIQLLVSPHD